jgi:hypothetical protein
MYAIVLSDGDDSKIAVTLVNEKQNSRIYGDPRNNSKHLLVNRMKYPWINYQSINYGSIFGKACSILRQNQIMCFDQDLALNHRPDSALPNAEMSRVEHGQQSL